MVVRAKNLYAVVCTVCLVLAISASPLFAQIVFNDFSNVGNLARNGSAVQSSNVLRITPAFSNQVGSAWYVNRQPQTNGFSTTLNFRFTNPTNPPADGIAFVIQNSTISAIGSPPNGGALGYGGDDANQNPQRGIPSSLAVEFDSFHNDWDPAAVNGNASHVAVQSCGTGNNTSHHGQFCDAIGRSSTFGSPVPTANLADGAIHKATIS